MRKYILVTLSLLAAGTVLLWQHLERQERKIRDLQLEVASLKSRSESDERATVVQLEPYRVRRQQSAASNLII